MRRGRERGLILRLRVATCDAEQHGAMGDAMHYQVRCYTVHAIPHIPPRLVQSSATLGLLGLSFALLLLRDRLAARSATCVNLETRVVLSRAESRTRRVITRTIARSLSFPLCFSLPHIFALSLSLSTSGMREST